MADEAGKDMKKLTSDLVREGEARLTDIEIASRMFTALLDCQAMFRGMTVENMRGASASVEIALAKAKGVPRPESASVADVFPTVEDVQSILDAMFEILARCHSGEFGGCDSEKLLEWTRRQLRLLGFDVVPAGMSAAMIRGRTPVEAERPDSIELHEAGRPN